MWVLITVGILFVAMGLMVHAFRWHFLISGYNTMPKERKENVDIKGLARLIGIYSYVNGSILILTGILYSFDVKFFLNPAILFFAVSTFYILIKAQKYDKNIFDEHGKLRKGAGKQFAIPVVVITASLIFVVVLLSFSSQATKVSFLDEGIKIHGMYGDVYRWEDIDSVMLMDKLPTITSRTNGSAIGSKLKGHFKTKELGSVKLFVDKQKPPFINLEVPGGIIIFNMNSSDETWEVYMTLLDKIK